MSVTRDVRLRAAVMVKLLAQILIQAGTDGSGKGGRPVHFIGLCRGIFRCLQLFGKSFPAFPARNQTEEQKDETFAFHGQTPKIDAVATCQ